MSRKKLLASKIDILHFIMKRRTISAYQLVEKFHYAESSAPTTLYRLKKAGLIINMTADRYELTEEGYRRLRYYGKR